MLIRALWHDASWPHLGVHAWICSVSWGLKTRGQVRRVKIVAGIVGETRPWKLGLGAWELLLQLLLLQLQLLQLVLLLLATAAAVATASVFDIAAVAIAKVVLGRSLAVSFSVFLT